MKSNESAEQLNQYVERIEQLESEIKAIQDDRKEVYAELKGEGFDPKVVRMVIARRKKNADEIAETEAILETYESALGIAYKKLINEVY